MSQDYRWPQWTRNALYNPIKGDRDRYTLFVFLLRNSLAPMDVIKEYMLWWVNHSPFAGDTARGQIKHVNAMIDQWNSGKPESRFQFLRKNWYSIVEHKEMQGLESVAQVEDEGYNAWAHGYPNTTTTTTHNEPVWDPSLLPPLPEDVPPNGEEAHVPPLPLSQDELLDIAATEAEFWNNYNETDEWLNEAYNQVKEEMYKPRKKLRRTRGFDEEGNALRANPL
jgi:hypothetical protein